MGNTANTQHKALLALDFQAALQRIEEQLRDCEDSETIINRLLQGAAEFYGANRASVVEADWTLNIGLLTYEWCAEGVEHQKDMLQYLAVVSFPRWCEFLPLNQPVVIPDMEAIRDTHPDEYEFFHRYGVKSILAAPFSKRINQGFIAVDDPTRFRDDPTFLFIISYAVVVELNEIKMQQTITAAQRVSRYSEKDVYINCFGSLEIKSAHGTLTDDDLSSDLCVNLLALLIIDRKMPVSTDRVVDALWPNGVMGNKYRAVSNILYRLRRTLSIIGLEEFIVSKNGTFSINPDYHVYTDFERFADNCAKLETEQNPHKQRTLYHAAVKLYRGELFEKIYHQHWLMPTAVFYHSMYIQMVKCFIQRKIEQHDYFTAYRTSIAALNFAPYDSDLNTAMVISMFYQSGAELAKQFLETAQEYMSDEQLASVRLLLERQR